MNQPILTAAALSRGVNELAGRDPVLARIVGELGAPPLWARQPGFATLLHIILEQQVSLASAKAAFDRLATAASPLTPESFLLLDDAALKKIGFSRQKTSYGRHLSLALHSGTLDLNRLRKLDDGSVREELMKVKGIGAWTADIYLLLALRRQDVWPSGDLALAIATRRALSLGNHPSPARLDKIGERWRPWRAVAARILWHLYLSNPARRSARQAPAARTLSSAVLTRQPATSRRVRDASAGRPLAQQPIQRRRSAARAHPGR
jgi:DNA-3-methyladenine glycosylase II